MLRRANFVVLLWLLAASAFFPVWAHRTTDSFLSLQITNQHLEGRWAISLRDLNHVLTIDANADGEASDAEMETARPRIQDFAFKSILFQINGQRVEPQSTGFEIEEHSDTVYAALLFNLTPPEVGPDLLIDFKLFAGTDPLHRGLFRFDLPERTDTAIFSPAQPTQRFLIATPRPGNQFLNFLREGVWHIWIGYDHILFLIALLLPSVLQRQGAVWQPAPALRGALANILKVITAFTVAHSITLTLAALGWVRLPARVVESVIALSVLLAAVNNVKAILPDRLWLVAFTFGLIHGFGFAGVLAELGLSNATLTQTLIGFNVGVEFGQLAIVSVFVPLAWSLRKTRAYREAVLPYGSVLIAALAGVWLLERAFDHKLLPF